MIPRGTLALATTVAGLALLFPFDVYVYRGQHGPQHALMPKLVLCVDAIPLLGQTVLLAAGLFLLICGAGMCTDWIRERLD